MIDEQIGFERVPQIPQQGIGHRCARKAELAHRAHIRCFERRVMQEVVVERGHQIKVGDLLGGDQFKGARSLEPRQTHKRAADERHRKERAHTHGVIERHDAERAFPAAVEILRDMRDRGRPFGAMAAGHAFGSRRRTRGIEHDRAGIGADSRLN